MVTIKIECKYVHSIFYMSLKSVQQTKDHSNETYENYNNNNTSIQIDTMSHYLNYLMRG